jgi:hypothetical protein
MFVVTYSQYNTFFVRYYVFLKGRWIGFWTESCQFRRNSWIPARISEGMRSIGFGRHQQTNTSFLNHHHHPQRRPPPVASSPPLPHHPGLSTPPLIPAGMDRNLTGMDRNSAQIVVLDTRTSA